MLLRSAHCEVPGRTAALTFIARDRFRRGAHNRSTAAAR
jgi:hypothetical protein